MAISYKVKCTTSHPNPEYLSKRNKSTVYIHTDLYIKVHNNLMCFGKCRVSYIRHCRIQIPVCIFFELYLIYFLYSRFLLVIHFIHISVTMSIPVAQFITPPPPPPPLSPLGVHTFVLYICVSISALQTGSSVPFF